MAFSSIFLAVLLLLSSSAGDSATFFLSLLVGFRGTGELLKETVEEALISLDAFAVIFCICMFFGAYGTNIEKKIGKKAF